jgi:Domain of unknown function (DUF5671)
LVSEPDPEPHPPSFSDRAAIVISQAYYYVVAAIGLALLLGGAIAALIALRKWIFPLPESAGSFGPFGGPTDTNDTARSFLGALAFAIPGALVLAWHLREARRREGGRATGASWGGVLYFHLVALISIVIALGGVIAALHGLRDAVVPLCYESPGYSEGPLSERALAGDPTFDEVSPIPPIELPADFDPELLRSEECYPSTSEALRSALDGVIVASVAGAAWVWHLRRGRRAFDGPLVEG